MDVISVSRPLNKPVRGMPLLRAYTGKSREVVILADEQLLKIWVPATDKKKSWTAQTLKAHIEYYLEWYKKKAFALPIPDPDLAGDVGLASNELRALLRVMVALAARSRQDLISVRKALNATRQELAMERLPLPIEKLTLEDARKILRQKLRAGPASDE